MYSDLEETQKKRDPKIMNRGTGYEVTVIAGEQKRSGKVWIETFTITSRVIRGLKFLGIFWGMMILAVFIPLIHFFLVPALFVFGIFGAMFVFTKTSIVLGGEAPCPKCGAFLPIARSTNKWPLTDLCTACRCSVTVEKRN